MVSAPRPTPRLLAGALLLAAAGCGTTSDVTGTGPVAVGVRVVQGVSDAPNGVDIAVNGATASTGVPFGTFLPTTTPPYAPFAIGSRLSFAASGANAFTTQVLSGLTANAFYTLVAYGRVTSGATPAATAAVLADTLADSTRQVVLVRAFNALDYVRAAGSTGGTPVDVYAYSQGSPRPAAATFPALAFGTRSAYATVAAGTLQVDVFAAGAASTGAPLFTTTTPTVATSIRTFVLLDPPSTAAAGTAGSVLVLNDYR